MKVLLIAFLLLLSPIAMADVELIEDVTCQEQESVNLQDQVARRGCCSHHGGVCGCGGATLRCCDGTNSPSCGCHAPDPRIDKFVPPPGELPVS
ncbi:MAG: hypothetical protein Q8J65_07750 [Nitrosomonadales bacterium]|nr:hypothetical protein [Nitrosomonadales bacterium]